MKNIYLFAVCLICFLPAKSQYMSRSQPVPFACPTVCPGSIITLEVFQVQSLNVGDTIQAWLSNASGSFSSGTYTLNSTAFSINTGTTWTPGAYRYTADINNLYIQVTMPANLPAGTGYTIKMKTSSGYVAGDLFSCSGSNYITVTSAYPTLGTLPIAAVGNNQWIGHVYSWVATTTQPLFTTQLVSAQDFFNANNYQGYFLKDSLGFNINYLTGTGGTCPGAPGPLNDGTNIPCSSGFGSLFSIRMLRSQNFTPGTYRFTIQGDDGIRFSIDGGNTWLLSSFFEQTYPNGFRSTDSLYPNGICLSGQTNLVIEYFQRNVDSHLSFTATQLSNTTVADAGNQTACAGANISFALANNANYTYQWYYSSDGGLTFNQVPNSNPFTGANTSTLGITSVPGSYNNDIFRCSITGICSNAVNTPNDTLFLSGQGIPVTITTDKSSICPHNDTATICAPFDFTTYLWSTGATSFCITTDTAGDFSVSVSHRGSCISTSNIIHVSVYPPITPVIQVQGTTLSVNSGSSFQWYGPKGIISGDTGSTITASSGSYYVTLIDSNGCPETSQAANVGALGLNQISGEGTFTVYPNPATDKCVVSVSNTNSNTAPLLIFDALGQLIMDPIVITRTAEVDMRNQAGGIYFFRLGNFVKRVIKE